MKTSTRFAAALGLMIPLTASAAHAQSWATIHDDGPLSAIQSRPMLDPFTASPANSVSTANLIDLHSQLAADGVETDDYITIILTETLDALSLVVLFDKETNLPDPATEMDVHMAMRAIALTNADYRVNDVGYDDVLADVGGPLKSVDALFEWESPTRGDAFAWTGLEAGDEMLFEFDNTVGTAFETPGVQFVTYADGAWQAMRTDGFNEDGTFSINMKIAADAVPGPGPIAMLGLAALAGRRSRRRRA